MNSLLRKRTFVLTLVVVFSLCFSHTGCTRQRRVEGRAKPDASNAAALININLANEAELSSLPHIGQTLARRIVEFRELNGPFRRPEHLLLVDGISEKRFREIRPLVTTY